MFFEDLSKVFLFVLYYGAYLSHLGSKGENSVIHCRDEAKRKATSVALLRGTASVAFFCTLIIDIFFDDLL